MLNIVCIADMLVQDKNTDIGKQSADISVI